MPWCQIHTTGAVPAMKPEATAIGDPLEGRWKITLMFDGRRFCISKLGLLRYSRRHINDVIGDFRPRPASAQPITAKLLCCDWLGRIGLLLTRQSTILWRTLLAVIGGFTVRDGLVGL